MQKSEPMLFLSIACIALIFLHHDQSEILSKRRSEKCVSDWEKRVDEVLMGVSRW